MKHIVLRLALAALLIATVSLCGYAQGGGSLSSLTGTVVDQSGGVIPGAEIKIKNNATGAEFTTITTESGIFNIPSLAPGTYTATVSMTSFKQSVIQNVVLVAGSPTTIRVHARGGRIQRDGRGAGRGRDRADVHGDDRDDARDQPDFEPADGDAQRDGLPGHAAGREHDRRRAQLELLQHARAGRQHHGGRREHEGQHLRGQLLQLHQPAPGCHAGSDRIDGHTRSGEFRNGRGPGPVHHAIGEQRLQRQPLLVSSQPVAELQLLVQQPGPDADVQGRCRARVSRARPTQMANGVRQVQGAADEGTVQSAGRPHRRPDRDPETS